MSQENVDLVRRGTEAFARNDWDTVLAEFDPDVEWVEMPSLGPDASSYTGREQVREAVGKWMQMWNEYDIEVCRYADIDDEVVVLARERGSGGVSGASVERELGEVVTVLDRKIVRVRLYGGWDEALKAAGLSE